MLSVTVSDNLKKVLSEITPQYEENLKDDFIDCGIRQVRRNERIQCQLKDVLVTDGNINTELTNLAIKEVSPCVLSTFRVNLEMFNIFLEADLRRLKIEGDFRQSSINTLVPMCKTGRITFTLDDTIFSGNVGIYIVDDSFMTINHDINVKSSKILSEVSCGEDMESKVFKNLATEIDQSLVKHLTAQLLNFFELEILYPQLAGTICDYSASELLLDEPDEMRSISSTRASKTNELVDSLLNSMNEYFRPSDMSTLETPPLVISFSDEKEYNIFESGPGQLQDLSTFERVDDMSYYEDGGIQYIYGNIKLKDFKFKYPSCKDKENLTNNGRIEVEACRSKIFIKLSLVQNDNSVTMSVEKVQALGLRDISFNVLDLDSLGSQRDKLHSWVMGSLQTMVFPLLEQKIHEGLTYVIKNKRA